MFNRALNTAKYATAFLHKCSTEKYSEIFTKSTYKLTEVANGGVLQKKVFLKISQNSQENTVFIR